MWQCLIATLITTNTIAAESHQPLSVWRQFVADTLHLRSIDDFARDLGVTHQCAFHMRHKILLALLDMYQDTPTMLGEVTELDETYVLESYKGQALPDDAGRAARKQNESTSMSTTIPGLCAAPSGSTLTATMASGPTRRWTMPPPIRYTTPVSHRHPPTLTVHRRPVKQALARVRRSQNQTGCTSRSGSVTGRRHPVKATCWRRRLGGALSQ